VLPSTISVLVKIEVQHEELRNGAVAAAAVELLLYCPSPVTVTELSRIRAAMPKEEESSTVNTSLRLEPIFGVRQGSVLSPQVRYLLQAAVAKHVHSSRRPPVAESS